MNKKFVLAPDSFKESLSAKEVCQAMERGIKKVFPEAEIILAPMADGGEGTIEALIDATEGRRVFKNVRGPLLKAAAAAVAQIPCGQVDELTVMNVSNFLSPGKTNRGQC